MIIGLPLSYLQPLQELPGYLVAIFFFVPLTFGIVVFAYKTRHARSWRNGIFPPNIPFREDNLLEAYLALGAILVLIDYGKTKGSKQFINQYFNRYFKKSNYNFGDSLIFSMKHPIKIDSVSDWLNKHLKEDREKAQVIYFLTGLAFISGNLQEKELRFLQLMNNKLHLKPQNLQRIIAIYQSYYANKKEDEKNKIPRSKINRRKYYSDILGVSGRATVEEIKKAYRKLAKQHHPDLFENHSAAQQQMAKDKFLQIQEAYEHLIK